MKYVYHHILTNYRAKKEGKVLFYILILPGVVSIINFVKDHEPHDLAVF